MATVSPKELPSEEDLRKRIHALVREVDVDTTPVKQVMKILSDDFDCDLKPQKSFIKVALGEAIRMMDDEEVVDNEEEADEESDEEESDENVESEEEAVAPQKKKKGGGGGFNGEKEISDKLARFLGNDSKLMSRPAIVKAMWEYIRKHDLQNPSNKREILLDPAMQDVFGCQVFTMFSMNKYIGEHVHPFKKADFSTKSSPTSRKIKKKRKGPGSGGAKKKRRSGGQPPFRLSKELEVVVGESVLPRPQVVSKLWEYIKSNDLQNPSDKREILCDDKLRAVMKKNKVSMFKMNQCISPHLLEKVEKVSYAHSDSESD